MRRWEWREQENERGSEEKGKLSAWSPRATRGKPLTRAVSPTKQSTRTTKRHNQQHRRQQQRPRSQGAQSQTALSPHTTKHHGQCRESNTTNVCIPPRAPSNYPSPQPPLPRPAADEISDDSTGGCRPLHLPRSGRLRSWPSSPSPPAISPPRKWPDLPASQQKAKVTQVSTFSSGKICDEHVYLTVLGPKERSASTATSPANQPSEFQTILTGRRRAHTWVGGGIANIQPDSKPLASNLPHECGVYLGEAGGTCMHARL